MEGSRTTLQWDNISVEYDVAHERFARAYGQWLNDIKPRFDERLAVAQKRTLVRLKAGKDNALRLISEILALPGSTGEMAEIYDIFTQESLSRIHSLLDFKKAVIWDSTTLRKRLEKGQSVTNFKLSNDSIDFQWRYEIRGNTETGQVEFVHFQGVSLVIEVPVLVDLSDLDATTLAERLEEAKKTSYRTFDFALVVVGDAEVEVSSTTIWLAIHEVAEVAMTKAYVHSNDRRWFSDGIANYIAYRYIQHQYGNDFADRLYASLLSLERYGPLLEKVDLLTWSVGDSETESSSQGKLNEAYYYLATEVIRAIADKHGEAIYTRIFQHIADLNPKQRTMEKVYAIFNDLTGEDMKAYISQTQARLIEIHQSTLSEEAGQFP